MSDDRTEMEKRDMLRLSNVESNKLTRECLQMALIHLMAEKDMEKISVSEIVKKAGVSRTAFYNNYSSKVDVLMSLSTELIHDLNRITREAFRQNQSRQLFERIFQRIQGDSLHFSMLLKSGVQEREFLKLRDFVSEEYPGQDARIRLMLLGGEGMIRNITLDWFLGGMKESVSDMAELCATLSEDLLKRIREIDPSFMLSETREEA